MSKNRFSTIRDQLDGNGRAYVEVTSTGMEPLLRPERDMVVVDRTHHIHRGDIVLFDEKDGEIGLRRVIRKGKDCFTVTGDNRWNMEKNLSRDQILGVVSRIQRGGRMISNWDMPLRIYTFLATKLAYPRILLGQITGRGEKTVCTEETREQQCA